MDNSVPEAFIFTKVGTYEGECLNCILERKRRGLKEARLKEARRIYWGYGGIGRGPLHPTNQVQPFVEEWSDSIEVLMGPIEANTNIHPAGECPVPNTPLASEFSVDEENWESLPSGVFVSGSRWALVLDEIRPCDLELDLRDYVVGIGDKKGTPATEYLKGQTSKGALVKANSMNPGRAVQALVAYRARLICPYAVFLE